MDGVELAQAADHLEQPLLVGRRSARPGAASGRPSPSSLQACEQGLQHLQEAPFLGRGVAARRASTSSIACGISARQSLDLAERELRQQQVVADLVGGRVHLPGAGELALGLGEVALLQRQQAHLQEDVGVGLADLAQGGAGLGGLALALVGQGEQVEDVGVLAAGLDGAARSTWAAAS